MIIKLVITNENDVVTSQQVKSEYNLKKDGGVFFLKLQEYLHIFINEYNKSNESKLKKLEVFDENDIKITELNKN